MSEERKEVTVTPKNGKMLVMCEGDASIARNDDGSYTVSVPAGGWFFGKF